MITIVFLVNREEGVLEEEELEEGEGEGVEAEQLRKQSILVLSQLKV